MKTSNDHTLFFNTVFLFSAFTILVIGYIRGQENFILGVLYISSSLMMFLLYVYLKYHKDKQEQVASVAIIVFYLFFTSAYLFTTHISTRIAIFILLLAAIYFLKGKRVALYWLFIIITTILLPNFTHPDLLNYTTNELITYCSYLIGFYLILNNFDSVRQKQSDELYILNKKLKTELNKTEEELVVAVEATMKDEISGLNSRSKFTKIANFELEQSKNYNFPLCLMALDINEFAMINTVYGPAIGDEVLRNVANTINNSKRDSDIAVRWAADEFFILLPKSSISDAIQIAEKIKKDLISNSDLNRYCVSISFGFTQYMTPDKLNRFISQVEDHLIRTKQRNKNKKQAA